MESMESMSSMAIYLNSKHIFIIILKIFFLLLLNRTLYINKKFNPPVLTTYIEDYYLRKYPELEEVYAYKRKQLYKYFYTSGISEGQSASPAFDVRYYLENNDDLYIFGNNYTLAYQHFMEHGKYEGRDLSPVFHLGYYINNNPDIANIFGNNTDGIMDHFLRHGVNEGRPSSPNFNLEAYKLRNEDLKNVFKDNNIEYYYHYCIFGKSEGRPVLFDNN